MITENSTSYDNLLALGSEPRCDEEGNTHLEPAQLGDDFNHGFNVPGHKKVHGSNPSMHTAATRDASSSTLGSNNIRHDSPTSIDCLENNHHKEGLDSFLDEYNADGVLESQQETIEFINSHELSRSAPKMIRSPKFSPLSSTSKTVHSNAAQQADLLAFTDAMDTPNEESTGKEHEPFLEEMEGGMGQPTPHCTVAALSLDDGPPKHLWVPPLTPKRQSARKSVRSLSPKRPPTREKLSAYSLSPKRQSARRLEAMKVRPIPTHKASTACSRLAAPVSPARSSHTLHSIDEESLASVSMGSLRSFVIMEDNLTRMDSIKSLDDWGGACSPLLLSPKTAPNTESEASEDDVDIFSYHTPPVQSFRQDFRHSKNSSLVTSQRSIGSFLSFGSKASKSSTRPFKSFRKSVGTLLPSTGHGSTTHQGNAYMSIRQTVRDALPTIMKSGVNMHLSDHEYSLIEKSLKKNFLFKKLCPKSLHALVMAFERTEAVKDEIIIQQGDTCEDDSYVYVIAEGVASVLVDGKQVPPPYGSLAPKCIFGELGVLYKANRAATIKIKTDYAVLFRASGEAFTKAFDVKPTNDTAEDVEDDLLEIDEAINQLCGTKSLHQGGDIFLQYKLGRGWLWAQWSGTVLEQSLLTSLFAMFISLLLVVFIQVFAEPTWSLGMPPDEDHPWIQRLSMINKLWTYMQISTIFTLTFYVSQAYAFWASIVGVVRKVQGTIADFNVLVATCAERNKDGSFTVGAEAMLDDISSSTRLWHALMWASNARRFKSVATPTGLGRLAHRGIMTHKQLHVLQSLETDSHTKYNAFLEWMMIRAYAGIEAGDLRDCGSLTHLLLSTMCGLRALSATIGDSAKSRMVSRKIAAKIVSAMTRISTHSQMPYSLAPCIYSFRPNPL